MMREFMKIVETVQPTVLYHQAPVAQRNRIAEIGLQHPYEIPQELGVEMSNDETQGIYFTDNAEDIDPRYDMWAVDVRGLALHPDETTDWPDGHEWSVTYDQVGPERLRLVHEGQSNIVEDTHEGGFSVSPEQAQKILSSRYLNRGVKIGKNTRLWRGVSEDSGSGMATYGTGLYFTANRKRAKIYGEVIEIGRSNLPDNPFRFDTNNNYEIWLHETREILGYDDMRKFATAFYDVRTLVQAIDPSADGIQVMTGADAMFVVYPMD